MGLPGMGTLLKMGDGGSPETFTTVAEVTELGGPEFTLDLDDTTSLDEPGGWEDMIPTVLRHGDIPITVNFDPSEATHGYAAGLLKKMVNKTKTNFQIVLPNPGATTWTVPAYVRRFRLGGITPDRKLSATFDLRPVGQPSLS